MKTKIIFYFFLLSLVVTTSLFPQEYDPVKIYETVLPKMEFANVLPSNLLVKDGSFNMLSFQFLDGTPVPKKESYIIFSTIPANQDILKQVRQGTITTWILAGLSIVSSAVLVPYLFADLPGAEIAIPITTVSVLASSVTASILNISGIRKHLRMVENYNMHILSLQQR